MKMKIFRFMLLLPAIFAASIPTPRPGFSDLTFAEKPVYVKELGRQCFPTRYLKSAITKLGNKIYLGLVLKSIQKFNDEQKGNECAEILRNSNDYYNYDEIKKFKKTEYGKANRKYDRILFCDDCKVYLETFEEIYQEVEWIIFGLVVGGLAMAAVVIIIVYCCVKGRNSHRGIIYQQRMVNGNKVYQRT